MKAGSTYKERGLSHCLEAAATVFINTAVTGSNNHQHAIIGKLLAARNGSFEESAASGCDDLQIQINFRMFPPGTNIHFQSSQIPTFWHVYITETDKSYQI